MVKLLVWLRIRQQHPAIRGQVVMDSWQAHLRVRRGVQPAEFQPSGQAVPHGVFTFQAKDLNLAPEVVPLLAGEVVNADQGGDKASANEIMNKLPDTPPNS